MRCITSKDKSIITKLAFKIHAVKALLELNLFKEKKYPDLDASELQNIK